MNSDHEPEETSPGEGESTGALPEPDFLPANGKNNSDENGPDVIYTRAEDPLPTLSLAVESETQEHGPPALDYPVVGFGASAGGLQAFREILENLDPSTGMAFVLVTHLAPDQKSFLSEIVERYTQMPVSSVENGRRPRPDHLYVLQPNQTVTMHDGKFRVEPRDASERFPKIIDKFFYSLAADLKGHAVGVVLSGADADGALGLKAIKGEGGIALVQSPESAVHGDMPRNSIASDHVDLVIPPAEIALELGRLARQFMLPEVRSLEKGKPSPDDEQSYYSILQLLRGLSGLDLRQYKPETIRRRIARRMLLLHIDQLSEYLRFLQIRNDELRVLQEDVLINVTRFFRDPGFWESLRVNVLPVLMQDRPLERPVRIWSAGCSTGEETFSLAMLMLEYLTANDLDSPIQIFGTDASEQSIETARTAVYPEALIADISPERLRRYFVKVDRGYQVSKRVRDCCIFARQNLSSDPPFSHVDILACRNVMIYFSQPLQRQVMLTFHYALEPGGYMLLGMSEGLRGYGEIFATVDRKHKLYLKTGATLPFNHEPPRSFSVTHYSGGRRVATDKGDNNIWPEQELQRAADRIVLARYSPPGLIVDERLNVLQSRGQTAQFLNIAPGAVTWNLLRVLRDELANSVQEVVQNAIRENVPASGVAVMMDEQNGRQDIQIEVLPITSAAARPRCFLILFQVLQGDAAPRAPETPALLQLTADEKAHLIAQLRQELTSTRFHLQSLVEERDARNQELVSANEEIQSANEELQSTNEELETTKEELQSANEELQTVNDELQQRNNVLTQTGNDLTNLLNSVNIPLLMLDSDLRIRQFTPPMQRLLNVRPSDVGRAISEIRLQLSIENVAPMFQEVLDSLTAREIEVQDREGRWHLLRVRPYRTAENKIEGLVVVLLDINELRKTQQHVVEARDFARAVVEGAPVAMVVLDQDFTIRTVNTVFRELTRLQVRELEGHSLLDLAMLLWGIEGMRERLEPLLTSIPGETIEFEHEAALPRYRNLLIKAQALIADGVRVLVLMLEDITARRQAEKLIATQKEELEGELAVGARTLSRTREELRELAAYLFKIQEEERQHVARELHDDVSQRLSLLDLLLHEIKDPVSREDLEKLESARTQLNELNTDVRQISHRLHPSILNDLGLSAALQGLVKEFGERENMPATYTAHDLPESWPPEAATAIYRIAQEALRNIAKHAGKTQVKVVLAGTGLGLQLKVRDFGIGFDRETDMPAPGLGMISMQERARLAGGTLHVHSALGQGTTVAVDIPLSRES